MKSSIYDITHVEIEMLRSPGLGSWPVVRVRDEKRCEMLIHTDDAGIDKLRQAIAAYDLSVASNTETIDG